MPTSTDPSSTPGADAPLVSVLVVDYRAGPLLDRCLEALSLQTDTGFEVVLLDNGSPAHEPIIPASLAPRVIRIRSESNLGFAGGNNLAATRASGRWLALLNPDAFAAPDWIESFREAAHRYPDVAMFGSTQLIDATPERLDGAGDRLHALCYAWRGDMGRAAADVREDARCFGPCAAAAFVRKDAFDAVGGFEERFFCYYEDVDLAYRLRLAGHVAVQLARTQVRHVGSATTGAGSDFVRYHVARNRIWMFARCTPGPLLVPLLPLFIGLTVLRLIAAPLLGDGRVRWRAAMDALAALPWMLEDRARLQGVRRATTARIAQALVWSPRRLLDAARDRRPPEVEP